MNCLLLLLLMTCSNSNSCVQPRNCGRDCCNRPEPRKVVEPIPPCAERFEERRTDCGRREEMPWNYFQNNRETCKCEEKPV